MYLQTNVQLTHCASLCFNYNNFRTLTTEYFSDDSPCSNMRHTRRMFDMICWSTNDIWGTI